MGRPPKTADSTIPSAAARAGLPSSVLDNLLEGCQVIGPDYRYLYVNEAVAAHGKASRETLLGRRMMDAYPGIERTPMFAALRRCMEASEPARVENEFTFPDGSTGWFELRIERVPEGVVILSLDITDRKAREQELRRAMRSLTMLSRSNHALVRAQDEQAFLQEICHIIVDSGGYAGASIDLPSPVDPRHMERVAHVGDLAVGSQPAVGAHTLPIASGGVSLGVLTVYAIDVAVLDDAERAVLGEMVMDVGHGVATLRARRASELALAALEEAEARQRAIYDHLPYAVFVWRQSGDTPRLVDCNEAAKTATRGAVARLVGQTLSEAALGIPHLDEDVRQCLQNREVVKRELQCVLLGTEEPRRLLLTYGFIPPNMVLVHAEDVTERRSTTEQLFAAQRLEAVGRLAGGVAHDFNNLLSVILSYADLALAQLPAEDPVRTDIGEVKIAAERAAGLTGQLLAFSRKQVLEPEVISLGAVVYGIEEMLRRLLGEDIEIVVRTPADLGNVMADRGQLEQVIMNLAVNARDAMPTGGRLTIETSNVDLDEEYAEQHLVVTAGPYVMLAMTDTGTGMDERTRGRIFEPFFTTKEQGKGTGLGLATVYGIVKQSEGNIWVYSEPGQGTTFKIYLPRVDEPARQRARDSRPELATGTETILLVEDEDAVRRAAERILRAAGYEVITAVNGVDAIELCKAHAGEIDLLVTDVIMPQMSGRTLADRLRAMHPELMVLFTSGYTDNAIVQHGILTSGVRFLAKPFSAADLTRKVRTALDERLGAGGTLPE